MPPVQTWLGCWGLNVGTHTCVCTLSFMAAQSWLFPAHTTKTCFVLSFRVAWLTKGVLLDEVGLGRWSLSPLELCCSTMTVFRCTAACFQDCSELGGKVGSQRKRRDDSQADAEAGAIWANSWLSSLLWLSPDFTWASAPWPFGLATRSQSAKVRMVKPLGLLRRHLPEWNMSPSGLVWLWKC